jgi:hypothetical protein
MKVCKQCKEEKPLEEFHKHPKTADGHKSKCRVCTNAYGKSYYESNKEKWVDKEREMREADPEALKKKNRDAAMRWRSDPENIRRKKMAYIEKRYGIAYEQYEAMEVEQSGLCKICRRPPNGRYNRLHVDHDHVTGRVRALICFSCNVGLGSFEDRVDWMRSAASYVESHQIT